MTLPVTPSAPLHSLLFQLYNIEHRVQSADAAAQTRQHIGMHTLLICIDGSGLLELNTETLNIRSEDCVLMAPGDTVQLSSNTPLLSYYEVSFAAIWNQPDRMPSAYTYPLLPDLRSLVAHPFAKLIRLLEELYGNRNSRDEINGMRQQLKLQELLLFLFQYNLRSEERYSPAKAVEQTIGYLKEHYMENLTVKQLARHARLPIWQFTSIFQKLTGSKPLDYLTDLRIARSKQLLRQSDEPLREIARLVGYADEYYFNRRFRQRTGMAPGQYAGAHRRTRRVTDWVGNKVDIPDRPRRIIYHGETIGDLLALGIKPIGGEDVFSWNRVYKHRLRKLVNVGFPIDPKRTGSLSPDLIIMATADSSEYNRVAHIAPTLTFNSFAPLEERMATLGRWLGREPEADAWLEAFNAKNAALWQRLKTGAISPGETASVLVFDHGEHLFAMGGVGLAQALYAPGGFLPVERIQSRVLDQQLGFAEIEPKQLSAYAGDRIFMLIPEREDSRAAMEQLLHSAEWNRLPAARNGRVYLLDAAKWNSGDALTRERVLTLLPKLLG